MHPARQRLSFNSEPVLKIILNSLLFSYPTHSLSQQTASSTVATEIHMHAYPHALHSHIAW